MRGQLIWFTHEKRHGFIRTEDGERLLVEDTGFEDGQLVGSRCAGLEVVFEREEADVPGGARAVHVSLVTDDAPRRARMRHHR